MSSNLRIAKLKNPMPTNAWKKTSRFQRLKSPPLTTSSWKVIHQHLQHHQQRQQQHHNHQQQESHHCKQHDHRRHPWNHRRLCQFRCDKYMVGVTRKWSSLQSTSIAGCMLLKEVYHHAMRCQVPVLVHQAQHTGRHAHQQRQHQNVCWCPACAMCD